MFSREAFEYSTRVTQTVEQPFTGNNRSASLTLFNRAAEVSSIECAKILLDYNADIDALNFQGQTAFHVVIYIP